MTSSHNVFLANICTLILLVIRLAHSKRSDSHAFDTRDPSILLLVL